MATSTSHWTDIHTSKHYALGTRRRSADNKEYIYLAGVASNVAGAWVHINPPAGASTLATQFTPVLAVADGQGPMAVSQAANTSATNYSWYQIYGKCDALVLASFDGTNGIGVWLTSTPGSLDDTDVAGDFVRGANPQTDRDTTTGMSTFFLNYPESFDAAID